jgi:hypothetical protein
MSPRAAANNEPHVWRLADGRLPASRKHLQLKDGFKKIFINVR